MDAQMDDVFFAEQLASPRRRYWIARDPPVTSNTQMRGWSFVYDEMDGQGQWRPGWDAWEEWFFQILRYPPHYSVEPLVWSRPSTGEVIDLTALQSFYDGKAVGSEQTPESGGLIVR